MLRTAQEASDARKSLGVRRPHCDPDLFKSPSVYADFLGTLSSKGMLQYRVQDEFANALGIFFVKKKAGESG